MDRSRRSAIEAGAELTRSGQGSKNRFIKGHLHDGDLLGFNHWRSRLNETNGGREACAVYFLIIEELSLLDSGNVFQLAADQQMGVFIKAVADLGVFLRAHLETERWCPVEFGASSGAGLDAVWHCGLPKLVELPEARGEIDWNGRLAGKVV